MSLSHHPENYSIPSLIVSGDILFSYKQLDAIKENLKSYEASTENKFKLIETIEKDLEHVITIYNENVLKINYGKSLVQKHEYPTFEQWQKLQTVCPIRPIDKQRADYTAEKRTAEQHHWAKLEINRNLAELAKPQLRLKEKIEKLILRAKTQDVPVDKLSPFQKLNFTKTDFINYFTKLREPNPNAIPFDAITRAPATSTASSSSSEQPASSSTTTITLSTTPSTISDKAKDVRDAAAASDAPLVQVRPAHWTTNTYCTTIFYPLENGTTLGICQDSDNWEKPVPFTSSDNQNWQVEFPFNHEFKYVIIKDGKVDKWELREGNRCFRPDNSLPPTSEPPVFQGINFSDADRERYYKTLQEAESKTTTSSEQPASPSVDVAQPVQDPHHSTTIHCPLADNEVLGICQDSDNWEKPVPFTSSDNQNWQVEFPFNHEFKYVIIKDGKVDKWEVRVGNRCLRPDSSIPSTGDEPPRF